MGFLEIEIDEFGTHGFDLFGNLGSHVKGEGHGAKRGCRTNRRQSGNPCPDHQYPCRRHLARRSHLTGKETAEIIACLDHRAVTGDIGHRRKRVHLLGTADPRHHVHGDVVGTGVFHPLQLLGILRRVEERDHQLTLAYPLFFGSRVQWPHLDDDIGRLPKCGSGFHHLDPGILVILIGKTCPCPGTGFDQALITEFLQCLGGIGGHRHPILACEDFLWCPDFQSHTPDFALQRDGHAQIARNPWFRPHIQVLRTGPSFRACMQVSANRLRRLVTIFRGSSRNFWRLITGFGVDRL